MPQRVVLRSSGAALDSYWAVVASAPTVTELSEGGTIEPPTPGPELRPGKCWPADLQGHTDTFYHFIGFRFI